MHIAANANANTLTYSQIEIDCQLLPEHPDNMISFVTRWRHRIKQSSCKQGTPHSESTLKTIVHKLSHFKSSINGLELLFSHFQCDVRTLIWMHSHHSFFRFGISAVYLSIYAIQCTVCKFDFTLIHSSKHAKFADLIFIFFGFKQKLNLKHKNPNIPLSIVNVLHFRTSSCCAEKNLYIDTNTFTCSSMHFESV